MSIEVNDVTKKFGSFVALDHVSFTVNQGELLALLGPSGSGKTTLLRIIAGLENADSGTVLFDGDDADRAECEGSRRRLRLSALRALPAHDGLRERRLRVAGASASAPPGGATRFDARSTSCSRWCSSTISATAIRRSSPADSGSASRWRARWPSSPRCCCSTSRSARSTPRSDRSCAGGCGGCTTTSTSRACS